ncbi:MAG: hypothetical protein IPI11_05305 [Haliscomenobacter sp.]|nr:hypothetical protein [Haliscomenobacter sp.]
MEERDGRLYGFEFKWSESQPQTACALARHLSEASFEAIHPGNYLPFIAE